MTAESAVQIYWYNQWWQEMHVSLNYLAPFGNDGGFDLSDGTRSNSLKYLASMMADASSCFAAVRFGRRPSISFLSLFLTLSFTQVVLIRLHHQHWKFSFHQDCQSWYSCSTGPGASSVVSWQSLIIPGRKAKISLYFLSTNFRTIFPKISEGEEGFCHKFETKPFLLTGSCFIMTMVKAVKDDF